MRDIKEIRLVSHQDDKLFMLGLSGHPDTDIIFMKYNKSNTISIRVRYSVLDKFVELLDLGEPDFTGYGWIRYSITMEQCARLMLEYEVLTLDM